MTTWAKLNHVAKMCWHSHDVALDIASIPVKVSNCLGQLAEKLLIVNNPAGSWNDGFGAKIHWAELSARRSRLAAS